MCAGVVVILAVLKFSTSPRMLGLNEISKDILKAIIIIGRVSLIMK